MMYPGGRERVSTDLRPFHVKRDLGAELFAPLAATVDITLGPWKQRELGIGLARASGTKSSRQQTGNVDSPIRLACAQRT